MTQMATKDRCPQCGGLEPQIVAWAGLVPVYCSRHGGRSSSPAPQPDYKALVQLAARVILQHMNDEDYEMSLAGLYATLTEHELAEGAPLLAPSTLTIRQRFEDWANQQNCFEHFPTRLALANSGDYLFTYVQTAFDAFKAGARAEVGT